MQSADQLYSAILSGIYERIQFTTLYGKHATRKKEAQTLLHNPIISALDAVAKEQGIPEGKHNSWFGRAHRCDVLYSNAFVEFKFAQSDYAKNNINYANAVYAEMAQARDMNRNCFYLFMVDSDIISEGQRDTWKPFVEHFPGFLLCLYDSHDHSLSFPHRSLKDWTLEFQRTFTNTDSNAA